MILRRWRLATLTLIGVVILLLVLPRGRSPKVPPLPGVSALRLLTEEPSTAPSFVDVSPFFGPQGQWSIWGVSWSDIDFDGDSDLFPAVHMHFPSIPWINENGLFFTPSGKFSGAETGLDDHMGLWSDFDGDGDPDLYSTNGFYRKDRLLLNDGDQVFRDATDQAGVTAGEQGRGRSALAADFTGNGFDDIVVSNLNSPDLFYRNLGNGQFVECGVTDGLANALSKYGAVAGDLDGDGDVDVYIPTFSRGSSNLLLLNRGDGVFIDRSRGSGADVSGQCFGAAIGDVDNDGDPDIFVLRKEGNLLLLNDGRAQFAVASETAGVRLPNMGDINGGFADLDNDTDLDLLIICGGRSLGQNGNNVLLMNNGDGTFSNISSHAGIQTAVQGKAAAVAFADYNSDGFLDFVVSNGFGVREICGPLQLYRNRGLPASRRKEGHWLSIRPERDAGSRDGNGARVEVRLPDGRTLVREAGGMRAMSQDQPGVHVGLGTAASAMEVCVNWPDGSHSRMQGVPADRTVILAARPQARFVFSHPDALLSRTPTFDLELAEKRVGERVPHDQWPSPSEEEITARRQEVIAYVVAEEANSGIAVDDDEIQAAYERRAESYTTPKQYYVDHIALGKFTTFRRQQALPWQLANQIKEELKNGEDALEIVERHNIRAFDAGERGYIESGWFTESMLRKRFGAFAGTLVRSKQGQVRGPVKIKEAQDIQDPKLVWPVLRIVRIGPTADEMVIDRDMVSHDLARVIHHEKLRSTFEVWQSLARPSLPPSRQGMIQEIRYNVQYLAEKNPDGTLLKREDIQHAFARIDREVRLDAAIRHLLTLEQPSPSDISAYVAPKRADWTRPAQIEGILLHFAAKSQATATKQALDEGESLEAVIKNAKIPNVRTREARNSPTYYMDTWLDPERARETLGVGAFDKLLTIEPGRSSDIITGADGHYLVVVSAKHEGEPMADSQAMLIGRHELERALSSRVVRAILWNE